MRRAATPVRALRQPLGLALIGFAMVLFTGAPALAKEYYVAPAGSDGNAGTIDAPYATLQKAVGVAAAGDTVWIRGGTYAITTPQSASGGINFTKSGTSDTNRIKYWAYPGEVPVFDFANLQISTTGYTMGFNVTGSWLHFKGLELCNVPMNQYSNNSISVNDPATNDVFELLNMHHNSGNGIFVGTKNGGGHLIVNCDAHDNFDATSNQGEGQNADGFGVHYQKTGATTIIRGCRAWWNSDDGYDLINQEVPVTVENSWAMGNGYANYGTYNPAQGNGNGFKMGSSQTGIRHLVQNNVAWKNKASGFYANHSSGGNTWYNNTSFRNGTQFNMLASPAGDPNTTITLTGDLVHIMRNNLGYPNKNSNMTGVDSQWNAWDLNLTPADKDFASVSDPSVSGTGASIEDSGALGPRQADGSMPAIDFLKLAAGSQMIDRGTDVGLPFVGAAPDLGAYEYGATATGTGGSVGAGGASGASGSGGVQAAGGGSGTGGRSGTGGAAGTGGSVIADGGPGRSDAAATGGAVGSGGAAASGGRSGTGGSAATATGGTAGSGGASASTGGGGSATTAGSGGASSSPSGTGGAVASGSGGSAGPTGSGGTTTTATTQMSGTSGGCSCRLGGENPAPRAALALVAFAWLLLRRRRAH